MCLCVCVCVYVYVYTYYVYARAHTHTYYNHFLSTLHPPQKCPALCTRISIPEPYALRPTPYALNLTPKYSSKPSSDASLYCNVVFWHLWCQTRATAPSAIWRGQAAVLGQANISEVSFVVKSYCGMYIPFPTALKFENFWQQTGAERAAKPLPKLILWWWPQATHCLWIYPGYNCSSSSLSLPRLQLFCLVTLCPFQHHCTRMTSTSD